MSHPAITRCPLADLNPSHEQPPTTWRNFSLALEPCCNCTSASTCQTKRCECKKAGRHCSNCRCGNCKNRSPSAPDPTTLPNNPPTRQPNHPPMSEEAHTTAENKIAQIYGEHIMCNDGTHINFHIQHDRVWQKYWKEITNLPNRKYNLPKNSTGKKFIHLLTTEINNIIDRKSNSEKTIVFLSVILQKSKSITKSKDVKALLERRMTLWQNK